MSRAGSSRLRNWLRAMVRITVMVVLVAAGFMAIAGRDETWRMIGGPADMGAVDFSNLQRASRPNNFLMCPPDICQPGPPDQISPVFPVSAERLSKAFHAVAMTEDDTVEVFTSGLERRRYVQRTPLMRFPDTISVRFIPLDENNSTLAVYSRSQIGYSDRGINQKRVYRWLEDLMARTRSGE